MGDICEICLGLIASPQPQTSPILLLVLIDETTTPNETQIIGLLFQFIYSDEEVFEKPKC